MYSDFCLLLCVIAVIWSRDIVLQSRAFASKFSFQLVYYIFYNFKNNSSPSLYHRHTTEVHQLLTHPQRHILVIKIIIYNISLN